MHFETIFFVENDFFKKPPTHPTKVWKIPHFFETFPKGIIILVCWIIFLTTLKRPLALWVARINLGLRTFSDYLWTQAGAERHLKIDGNFPCSVFVDFSWVQVACCLYLYFRNCCHKYYKYSNFNGKGLPIFLIMKGNQNGNV